MLGRDIKTKTPKWEKKEDKPEIFYINDFFDPKRVRRRSVRPQTVPQIGMQKIRAKTSWGQYFIEFATSSTVHGLNHLTAPRRHPVEKFLTVLFIVGSLIALIFLSMNFWNRFQNEATYIVLNHDYKNFEVTAPAIVVCPEERIDESKFGEVFKQFGIKNTNETRNFFDFIARVTYRTLHKTPNFTAVEPELWLPILNSLKPKTVKQKTAFPPGFDSCLSWIITEAGFCLSYFNYIAPYLTFEYWKSNNWTVIPPERISYFDYLTRQSIVNLQFFGDTTVMITNPGNIAKLSENAYEMQVPSTGNLRLYTAEVSTSSAVQDLTLKQRNCKFPDENHLKLWPIYTYSMCNEECRYGLMRDICGCHPHFVRPLPGIPRCNTMQLRCISMNLDKVLKLTKEQRVACGCYPDCTTTIYTERTWYITSLKKGSPTLTAISVWLDYPKAKHVREIVYGFYDFLTSVGGAAGLFLGASVISFIEIFYFATLRLFWYTMKRVYPPEKKKMKRRRGEPEMSPY